MGKVYASYMPIPLDSWDYHPNSFTAIFSDQYCGCYYSFVWSQVCKIVNFYDIEPCAIECLWSQVCKIVNFYDIEPFHQ
jgi:uncharacterized membrane protein YoaT (DUF817 family)